MSKIPESIEGIFKEMQREILWLHTKWTVYRQLFAHSQKRIELLNKCAAVAFYTFEEVLFDEIQMSLSKLTDPAGKGNKKTLSFEQLQKQVKKNGDRELASELKERLDDLKEKSDVIRTRRNKRLAHLDLKTAMDQGANLDSVSREIIEEVLTLVRKYMDTIERHYCRSDTEYEYIVGMSRNDGDALVSWLKDGLDFSELATKLGKGRNELRSGKWSDA